MHRHITYCDEGVLVNDATTARVYKDGLRLHLSKRGSVEELASVLVELARCHDNVGLGEQIGERPEAIVGQAGFGPRRASVHDLGPE